MKKKILSITIYGLLLLFAGKTTILVIAVIMVWGVAAGAVANTIQYWVASEALEAPEFAMVFI